MSKIEVIPHTIIHIDGMSNDAEIIAAATTCGDYAWCLNFYDDEQQWQLIPESLYIELVKFSSAHIQIGDKVKLNELGVKAILDNSREWGYKMIAKLLAENRGTITELSLSNNLFIVEFGTATFYLSAGMFDKIGGEL